MIGPRARTAGPRRGQMRREIARAMTVIGIGSIITAVFVFTPSLPEYIDLVDLEPAGAVTFLLLGLGSVVAGIRRSALLSGAAAVGFALATLAQLAQLATGVVLLGGDASSLSLFLAGAVGVTCLLWANRAADPDLDSRNG